MSIKGNSIKSEVSLVEPKDTTIPRTIDKVIEKFKVQRDTECKKVTKDTECKTVTKDKDNKPKVISDVKVPIPRLRIDEKKVKHARPSQREREQNQKEKKKEESATETKKGERVGEGDCTTEENVIQGAEKTQ